MEEVKYNDYPLIDCVTEAEILVKKGVIVYQKYTCDHCGSRQTIDVPNKFYLQGECEECKEITDIGKKGCNYIAYAKGAQAQEAIFAFMNGSGDDNTKN